jgi:hypothetical protein
LPLPPFLQRIVDFLRAGYPEGVPQRDYIPLFALLGERLSSDDVAMVADELAAITPAPSGEDSAAAIREAFAALDAATPSADDLARVQARLEAAGWSFDVPLGEKS